MRRFVFLVALAPLASAQLPDLIFERGNTNAYQTLQAALDAAQPGQRVVMRSAAWSVSARPHGIIRRSITLEGQYTGDEITMDLEGQGLRIESLTQDVPLVLRNLDLAYTWQSGYTAVAISGGFPTSLGGSIILDRVRCTGVPCTWSTTLVSLDCDTLEMRHCQLLSFDTSDNVACCSVFRTADGTNGLRFLGRRLYVEDCTIRGGNANVLGWTHPDNCFGYLCPEGGLGGSAVYAPNASCVAVRTFISDGNGGSVSQSTSWPRPPTQGRAVPSVLRELLVAYGFQHEAGRDGAGGPGTPRGPTTPIGYLDAPLSLGVARIGAPMTITVSPSALDPIAVLLGSTFVFAPTGATLFGAVHVITIPAPPVLYHGVGKTSLRIPPLPELIDQQVVGQVVTLHNAFPFLSNPSVSRIGR
jgi:hypothetical protein